MVIFFRFDHIWIHKSSSAGVPSFTNYIFIILYVIFAEKAPIAAFKSPDVLFLNYQNCISFVVIFEQTALTIFM